MGGLIQNSLAERSEIYYERAEVYERFSQAEDAGGAVLDFLAPRCAGLDLLDVGCGSGKYLRLLSPWAKSILGVDAAPAQLEIAAAKIAGLSNVEIMRCDALDADWPRGRFGAAIACWMVGTVLDLEKRRAIVEHVQSALAPSASFYLVENDDCGEFEEIRSRQGASRSYHAWLATMGFARVASLGCHFQFQSQKEARGVIGAIWGDAVGAKVGAGKVGHAVAVFERAGKPV